MTSKSDIPADELYADDGQRPGNEDSIKRNNARRQNTLLERELDKRERRNDEFSR